ncbi:dTDP-glucose 4,6-dehydratase [Falsibacillus albus]|uniref:dTDP-glucose 4,6-dehydratase n=1 Tax=Falsibacillus albus TaxID=2478915 RepID=A0A3L7K1V7_9BACI|nr:dTDP-glucose 4,6-dehydratase [Falsibacillus albus]RLQ96780.1 dTDP-glucose 4,6-dehydratase [Falsibacillus albus]
MDQGALARTILVTGGAGFIGSHFIHYWLGRYPHDHIINVDKLSYASSLDYLKGLSPDSHTFVHADLAKEKVIHRTMEQYKPDHIIHLAAESHVDQSIQSPCNFISSNIVGTFHLLEEARKLWTKEGRLETSRFVHISTDEVYGSLTKDDDAFSEESSLLPNSPYSATKAASDHLVRAYWKTYGLQTLTTRCSNNFGPHQHEEKFIPKIIHNALNHQSIPVYGNGEQIRDWLYVLDHCRAIDAVFHRGQVGEIYNIGAQNERRNLDLVSLICHILNEMKPDKELKDYKKLITFVEDRPGHDFRYAMNADKLKSELNWKPDYPFEYALKSTVRRYIKMMEEKE